MRIRRAMPVVVTNNAAASRTFYESFLGFRVAMEQDGMLMLASISIPTTQLIVVWDSPTAVDPDVRSVDLSVEVDDVDGAYRSAQARGLEIVRELRDEPWGIRRFFVRDPAGAVVNVASHITSTARASAGGSTSEEDEPMSTTDGPSSAIDADPRGAVEEARPPLDDELAEAEFRRWYWLREELAVFARARGVSASGSKAVLTERLAGSLAGRATTAPPRRSATPQLVGPLTTDTVVPVGQRASQLLRAWFLDQVGASFRFDAAMREHLAAGGGTLGDAVAFWHASRTNEPRPIDPQFELNRFTRAWHAEHPSGDRTELLAAWREYRSLPADQRARA